MRVVYSVEVNPTDEIIFLPENARILQLLGNRMIILADPKAEMVERRLKVLYENELFDETKIKCDYVGSFLVGKSIVHLVELVD